VNDTLDKCENEYAWMLKYAENIFYDQNYFNTDKFLKSWSTKARIKIIKKTAIQALIENKDKDCAILNFASAKHPGGVVLKGSVTQEESLARVSTLLPMLNKCTQFYETAPTPYYTDKIIYSKNIYVFKDDYGQYIEPIKCDIITCAAPNYNYGEINLLEHERVIRRRFTKIIKAAIANGPKTLILGAWGCGVFKNPSDVNARIFREVLDAFSESLNHNWVIFAIPDDKNYEIFKENLI
jgi:uncharacterized protein (TIGR02452 family)